MKTIIRVPATTGNLGPGFDSLGLALAIWNEVEVESRAPEHGLSLAISGFGAQVLPQDSSNLILRAAGFLFAKAGISTPGMHIRSRNHFPNSSGMGSSSSAILMGLLAANSRLPSPFSPQALLDTANEIEGHPDNVAPAMFGGLVMAAVASGEVIFRKIVPDPGWRAGIIVPEVDASTESMRAALKDTVTMQDAVFNISRSLLVVQAFERGDLSLLARVMDDRLHQPYRLPLIAGAAEALEAARRLGAAAALSGAGPGVVTFSRSSELAARATDAMAAAFRRLGVNAWRWVGELDDIGAQVLPAQ